MTSSVTTNGNTPPISLNSAAAAAINGIGSSARFRHRKISLKQSLRVLWEKDVPNVSEFVQREVLGVETGVEKGEEEEHHLQAVINATTAALHDKSVKRVYIPTPKATTKWPDYDKYYKVGWTEPESYIRSSATVDDAECCPYCLDERDETFLGQVLNKGVTETKQKCSEDEFEMISYLLDSTVQEKQPFLAMDPNLVLAYKELEQAILEEIEQEKRNAKQDPLNLNRLLAESRATLYTKKYTPSPYRTVANSFKLFGERIYEHWKERKIERHGKTVFPSLKFETDVEKDDNDPYVCFRRREVRQTRKTRRTDQQSSERLRRLRTEMEQAQNLFKLIAKREQSRLLLVQTELDVFEQRIKFKTLKRKLHIDGDEALFVNPLKRSRKEEAAQRKREEREREKAAAREKEKEKTAKSTAASSAAARDARAAAAEKVAAAISEKDRGGLAPSRIPDLEVVSLEDQQAERAEALRKLIEAKTKDQAAKDIGWINLSDNVPWLDYFDPPLALYERDKAAAARISEQQAAYSPIESLYPPLLSSKRSVLRSDVHVFDVVHHGKDVTVEEDLPDLAVADDTVDVPRMSAGAFRKRIDRNGVVFIDRKGLVRAPTTNVGGGDEAQQRFSDRYKFDSENELEHSSRVFDDIARLNGIPEPVQRLRFGAMLTAKAYEGIQQAQEQRRKVLAAQAAMANRAAQAQAQAQAQAAQAAAQAQRQQAQAAAQARAAQARAQGAAAAPRGHASHAGTPPQKAARTSAPVTATAAQRKDAPQSTGATKDTKKAAPRVQPGWTKPPHDGKNNNNENGGLSSLAPPKVETSV